MLCYWMCNILELLAAEWCWCSLNGCGEDDGDNIFFSCNTIQIQCLKAVTFVKGEESYHRLFSLGFFYLFYCGKKDFWKYMFIKKRTFNCGIVQWHDSATQRGSLKCNLTYRHTNMHLNTEPQTVVQNLKKSKKWSNWKKFW